MIRRMACVVCAFCLAAGVAAPARAQRSLRGGQPSPAQRLYREGKEAVTAREYGQAVKLFQQALDRATHTATRANILNDLGEAYYELEQFEDARDAFEAALNIRPNFTRARANLDIVHWALPENEEAPRERLSPGATFAGQVVGSYMTGAVIGGWFIFFGRLMGYKETDGQLALLGAGLVFGSTLRVSEVAREWSYGHGAQRNAVAGALVAPLTGVLATMLADGGADGGDRVRGARIGAYFSPLLATAGYTLSTSRLFGNGQTRRPRGTASAPGRRDVATRGPVEGRELVVSLPIVHISF